MICEGACRGDPGGERRQSARVLEGIPRRHEPPNAVEPETLQGKKGGSEMSLVGRIESSAEQADSHAGRMWR
jgi:hypothetical protein